MLDGRSTGSQSGFFLRPSIFDDVQPDMTIAKEEIFGPVLTVIRTRDLDEALAVINGSRFGNAASIFTRSGAAARRFRTGVETGMVGINVGVAAPPWIKVGNKRLHRFENADRGKSEVRSPQPQNSQPEDKGEQTDRNPRPDCRRNQRPSRDCGKIESDVAAQAVRDDVAEIDIAGVADHQVDVAGQCYGNRYDDEIFPKISVTGCQRQNGKHQSDAHNHPEERPCQHQPPLRKIPLGNKTSATTKRPNIKSAKRPLLSADAFCPVLSYLCHDHQSN